MHLLRLSSEFNLNRTRLQDEFRCSSLFHFTYCVQTDVLTYSDEEKILDINMMSIADELHLARHRRGGADGGGFRVFPGIASLAIWRDADRFATVFLTRTTRFHFSSFRPTREAVRTQLYNGNPFRGSRRSREILDGAETREISCSIFANEKNFRLYKVNDFNRINVIFWRKRGTISRTYVS